VRVAYIVSLFPKISETFILREMQALRRRGVEITIVSLKRRREAIVHPDALAFLPATLYVDAAGPVATAFARRAVRSPLATRRRSLPRGGRLPRHRSRRVDEVPAFGRRRRARRAAPPRERHRPRARPLGDVPDPRRLGGETPRRDPVFAHRPRARSVRSQSSPRSEDPRVGVHGDDLRVTTGDFSIVRTATRQREGSTSFTAAFRSASILRAINSPRVFRGSSPSGVSSITRGTPRFSRRSRR